MINRETSDKEALNEVERQMSEHIRRLCDQEEIENLLMAYRVDPEEEEGYRYLFFTYPVWEAEICCDQDSLYCLLKKGYGFPTKVSENIVDIYERRYSLGGERRIVDYDTYKNIFLEDIFTNGFLEKYFIEKQDDATEAVCRELEDYILGEDTDLTKFYETIRQQKDPAYASYFPRLMKRLTDAP